MVYNFMSDGIPIVYYGQEQGFHGNGDPVGTFSPPSLVATLNYEKYNREPLWTSGYANTTTYELITSLNQVGLCAACYVHQ